MKKLNLFIRTALTGLILFSCSGEEMDDLKAPGDDPLSSLGTGYKSALTIRSVPVDVCNESPVVFELMAVHKIGIGWVTLVNDASNLYVSFETTDGSRLHEIYLYAGASAGIPLSAKRFPIPQLFPYMAGGLDTNAVTLAVPLADIPDACPMILAETVMDNGEIAWAWERDNPSYNFSDYFHTHRWGYLGDYCVASCGPDSYLTFKTWFMAGNKCLQWGAMEADEHFFRAGDWCEKLGVFIPKADTVIRLIQYDKILGEVYLSPGVAGIHVRINFDDQEVQVQRTHVFYGPLDELLASWSCPDYENFPYLFEGDEGADFVVPWN